MSLNKIITKDNHWERLWSNGVSPGDYWDKKIPLPFLNYILNNPDNDNNIPLLNGMGIIPGFGRGYAIEALAKDDIRKIIGVDISKTAIKIASEYLNKKNISNYELINDSFFNMASKFINTFDFAYDYTFLCALQINNRKKWAKTYHSILKDDGLLMTVIYPVDESRDKNNGPPFALNVSLVESLLVPLGFKKIYEKTK